MVVDPGMMRIRSEMITVQDDRLKDELIRKLEEEVRLQRQLIELYKEGEKADKKMLWELKDFINQMYRDRGWKEPFKE